MQPEQYQTSTLTGVNTPVGYGLPGKVTVGYHLPLKGKLLKRRLLLAGIVVIGLLLLEVAIQLLYPGQYALPRASLGAQKLGFADQARIISAVKKSDQKITLLGADGDKLPLPIEKLGLAFDGERTARALKSYSLKERLVPFSVFRTRHLESPVKQLNTNTLNSFLPTLQQLMAAEPKNAHIQLNNETVEITPDIAGTEINTSEWMPFVQRAADTGSSTIPVTLKRTWAAVHTRDLDKTKEQADQLLAKKITVQAGSYSHELSRAELASFIAFIEIKDKPQQFQLDDAKLMAYIGQLKQHVETGATATNVNLLDNEVQSSTAGRNGTALDNAQTSAQLKAQLLSQETQPVRLSVVIANVPSGRVNNYTYSATNKGLDALLTNLSRGGSYRLSVVSLNGDGRSASTNDSQIVSASLYKLFIAQVLSENIATGNLNWSTTLSTGQTIDYCFERMIVHSEDRCSIAIAQAIGWQVIDDRLAALGYGSTHLNNYNANGTLSGNKLTSARDLSMLLQRLYNGTFASADYDARLLDAMRRQVYRQGIPKGAHSVVANKVGYVDGYMHDVGIIYGKNKVYAVTILSYGGNWPTIVNITTQIEDYFGN